MDNILREEFVKIGCTNPKTIALATQTYLELCEVKRYWNVNYYYHTTLENVYFTAKIRQNEEDSIFIPCEISRPVSLDYIRSLFQLSTNPGNKIFIVIVHPDSTCIHYQIFDGLLEPIKNSKINPQERSRKIDKHLRRSRELIEHAALCGIPITLPSTKTEIKDENETQRKK